jgi:asparagine synthase (glutamine-hydrolysing)
MCGIAGIVGQGGDSSEQVRRMLMELRHRGPDGEGLVTLDRVTLGHRRLSIIDLATGSQPLCNEDGTIWITFNGEIYNYRELRSRLEALGHVFRTNSDTETIVHAYEEWKQDCLSRLRGMFAFAIVDTTARELFLARDHFGIKPLFYRKEGALFAFASELQALRAHETSSPDIDLAALDLYLQFQYIPAPHSIYRSIRKLPAAHFMRVDFQGNIIEITRYWRFRFQPDDSRSEAEWIEGLEEVLRDSVRAHLVADVPFGAFLSGGIDSSLVVAYMAKLMDAPVKTFSVGFRESEYDETVYSDQVARIWGTDHHRELVEEDSLAILPLLLHHYGEPFADNSVLPTYFVSRLARRHVPMVLTGDAGDEIFGGYEHYTNRWSMHLRAVPEHYGALKGVAYRILNMFLPRRYPLISADFKDFIWHIQRFRDEARRGLWREEIAPSVPDDANVLFADYFAEAGGYGHFQKAQYLDFNTFLPCDGLRKVDIASMANSLECRTPLLDLKVVEYASRIPEHLNVSKVGGRWVGKLMLKKIARSYYDREFIYRRKMGFVAPVDRWILKDGKVRGEVRERLLDQGRGIGRYFRSDALRRVVERKQPHQIWPLLVLQEWMEAQ